MNTFKVGVLFLLAIICMVTTSLMLTVNQSGFGKHIEYYTIMDDASGIFEKSSIKVAGINAGKIIEIDLVDTKAKITFELREDIKLTSDASLIVQTVGLLGDKFIAVKLGNPALETLPEGSFVTFGGGIGMEELTKNATETLDEVKEIARTIREALKEGDRNLVKEIIANVNKVSFSMKNIIVENERKVNRILDNIERISEQVAYETDRAQTDSFMSYLQDVKPILQDTKETMSNVKVVVNDFKAGKGTAGKLFRDETVVNKVDVALTNVNKLLNRINNIEAEMNIFTGMNSAYGSQTQFDVDLYMAPERFFRLGAAFNKFGGVVNTETQTTTTINGVTTVVNEEVIKDSAFKFNAMLGRRYGKWGFRVGLIESEGGIGIDYYLDKPEVQFALDAFSYDDDQNPYVRLTTEFKLWNMVYARISGENLISKTNDRTFTVSAGLKFNDQDLAALLGLLTFR